MRIQKVKVIYNNLIPFKGFVAINLFGIIFVRKEYKGKINKYIINHELIHSSQMKECGYIFFYLIYLLEWLIKSIIIKKSAYRNISFEVEAYNNCANLNYLNSRKHYSWLSKLFY